VVHLPVAGRRHARPTARRSCARPGRAARARTPPPGAVGACRRARSRTARAGARTRAPNLPILPSPHPPLLPHSAPAYRRRAGRAS
jgi:hypothetical protein